MPEKREFPTHIQASRYYLDLRQATLHPEGACLSALLILEELERRGVQADAIGGPGFGADPIVASVSVMSYVRRDRFKQLPGFLVSKERKEHGTRQIIQGWRGPQGSSVVVVDDVCTTGGSIMKAIVQAEAAGYNVAVVISVVDREEGGMDNLRDYPYFSLFRASELTS